MTLYPTSTAAGVSGVHLSIELFRISGEMYFACTASGASDDVITCAQFY